MSQKRKFQSKRVSIGYSSNPEYVQIKENKSMEALRDRTVKIDMHHFEEIQLEELCKTKDIDKLLDIADQTACDEDEDCLLEPMLDGIYAALDKDKNVWVVEYEEYNYLIFIDKFFEKVKDRINKVPNMA